MSTGKMDPNVLNNGLEALSNMSKIAANLSNRPAGDRKTYREGDSTNQPHNQTVEVKVGSEESRKPVVVHEKKETHIHKPFPDSRNLTTEECEVEKMRIQLEFDDKQAEREFRMKQEEEARKERREREEYARRERERKREEDKKFGRRLGIGAAIAGAAFLGLTAYGIYSDSRRTGSTRLALPKPEVNLTIGAEGTVK